jgi:hypothetical protein
MMADIEMKFTGCVSWMMMIWYDDSGGGTNGSGGGGSGDDDDKYNSPLYMIAFPYL